MPPLNTFFCNIALLPCLATILSKIFLFQILIKLQQNLLLTVSQVDGECKVRVPHWADLKSALHLKLLYKITCVSYSVTCFQPSFFSL